MQMNAIAYGWQHADIEAPEWGEYEPSEDPEEALYKVLGRIIGKRSEKCV